MRALYARKAPASFIPSRVLVSPTDGRSPGGEQIPGACKVWLLATGEHLFIKLIIIIRQFTPLAHKWHKGPKAQAQIFGKMMALGSTKRKFQVRGARLDILDAVLRQQP